MRLIKMRIDGMHCDGCAQTIKALMEREPGVKTAAVSFEDGEARVLYDPQAVAEDRLVTAIEKSGYRVRRP